MEINKNSSREEVLAANETNLCDSFALEFIADHLKADREVVLKAVRNYQECMNNTDQVLRIDPQNIKAMELGKEYQYYLTKQQNFH